MITELIALNYDLDRITSYFPVVGGIIVFAFIVRVYLLFKSSNKTKEKKPPRPSKNSRNRRLSRDSRGRDKHLIKEKPVDTSKFSLPLIQVLEWKRFEEFVAGYYRLFGYTAKTTRTGADGGVDVVLFKQGNPTPAIIVQCKSWSKNVGVKPVRELLGVMTADEIGWGIFATTSGFTEEAKIFAQGKNMTLMGGLDFLNEINKLQPQQTEWLLKLATQGDFITPTCPQCDVKMVARESKRGAHAGLSFWGCTHYPKCKHTFKLD